MKRTLIFALFLTVLAVAPAYASWSGSAKKAAESYVDSYHPAWADRWSVTCHSGGHHVANCTATFPRGAAVGCKYKLKVTGTHHKVRKVSATC
jgi:hypothetical protein